MSKQRARPPREALAAFAADPTLLTPLEGGQATSFRCGDVILKPSSDPVVEAWIAQASEALPASAAYRLARPRRATHGTFVHAGWCAWNVLAGDHGSSGRWREILEVARELQADLAGLERAPFMNTGSDFWSIGHRWAWAIERPPLSAPSIAALVERCDRFVRPDSSPNQVLHSDVYGNVLFAPDAAPAVIDLSPCWFPADYGLAILAADAIAWFSEPLTVIEDLHDIHDQQSMLARAAIFRLVTGDQFARLAPQDYEDELVADFERLVALIEGMGP
jgi:uncharacterized protein (TIGR02569 family)